MASKTIRNRDALAMEVVPDSGNNSPLGGAGRAAQSGGLIHVVRGDRHTGSNRRGRPGFIDNPDMQAR